MKKTLIALIVGALCSCGIPIPPELGGGTIETTPVYHDPTSPDNSRTNPKAVFGSFTRRVPAGILREK